MVQCATRRCDERSGFAGERLLPVSAVMPTLGRCSGLEKLGAAAARKRASVARAPRQRSGAAVLPDVGVRASETERHSESDLVVEAPLSRSGLQPGGWGRLAATGPLFHLAARTVPELGVVAGGMLRVLVGCAAGVKPDADPVQRITVNVGSAPGAPGRGGGRARRAVC